MKFALYIEPIKSSHATFYHNILLKRSFEKLKHSLDIFIPNTPKNKIKKEDDKNPYVVEKDNLSKTYNFEITNDFPNPLKYDVLIIYEDYTKEWSGKYVIDYRENVSQLFSNKNKPVICLKFDTIMEYRMINNQNVIYGVVSNILRPLSNKFPYILPGLKTSFDCPVISNMANSKPPELSISKEKFFEMYGLDPNKKIIAYLPGKIKKWRQKPKSDENLIVYANKKFPEQTDNFKKTFIQVTNFFNNLDKISQDLDDLGYQLVGKLHIRDSEKFIGSSATRKGKITYIDQLYSHELLKYSSFAITFATTMVYQLYLYDLPSLDIGTGVYYPNWAFKNKKVESPLQAYNNGLDLIYGLAVNYEQFIKNPKEYLRVFGEAVENGQISIDKFKYRYNNPIYGNSYGKTTDDVARSVLGLFKK